MKHEFPFGLRNRRAVYPWLPLPTRSSGIFGIRSLRRRPRGQFYLSGISQSPNLSLLRPIPPTLFLPSTSLVAEICSTEKRFLVDRNLHYPIHADPISTPDRRPPPLSVGFAVRGALAGYGRGYSCLSRDPRRAQLPLFRPVFATPCPPVPFLVAEIRSGRRLACPAGKGNAAILPSMAPNSRRVRWLSARSSQY
jgi:hypothetical protein